MIVSNTWVQIPDIQPMVRQILDAELRYATVQGRMNVRDPDSNWDGWVRFLHKRASGEHVFPTGLLPRVCRLLRRMDLPYALEETRVRPPLGQPVGERIPLYDYQEQAVAAALDAGRGVVDSPPRCHARGQLILMHSGELQKVELLKVGDLLRGPDGLPRRIAELHSGRGPLFRIVPNLGGPWVVNGNHVLSLHRAEGAARPRSGYLRYREKFEDVTVNEYLRWPSSKKHVFKLYRRPASPKQQRELLAGLLDTDGYLSNGSGYEIVTASDNLAQDVAFVARSLGFACSIRSKTVAAYPDRLYWRLLIQGDLATLPLRVTKKKTDFLRQRNDCLRTGFSVEPCGEGDFFGFTLEGDPHYLLGDFTVTHNSGKTRTVAELVRRIGLPAIWVAPTSQIVQQTVATLEAFLPPGAVVGLVGSAKAHAAKDALVVVCTTATAAALSPEFFVHIQVMIWDEWHHAGAKTYKALFRLCDHVYYRYGMTGTHYRSGEDGMSMEALLGNVVFKISSAELVARSRLVPLDVLFLQTHFERVRADPSDFIGGFGKYGAFEHVGRNQLVARTAAYLLGQGRKVLVLVRTRAQGRMVAEMLQALVPPNPTGCRLRPVEYVSAEAKRRRINEVIEAFVGSSEVRCLVGTSLIGEGTDLPMADALVYAAAGSAQVTLMQNAYRVCTQVEGKPARALLVDFSDRHHHKLLAQSIARLQVYSQEPTFAPHYVESPRQLAEWMARQAG